MKKFYYGLLIFLPIYFLAASNQKVEKISNIYNPLDPLEEKIKLAQEDAQFLPTELREEFILLISIPEHNKDDAINDRIREYYAIITKNMEKIGYEEATESEMENIEKENNETIEKVKTKEKSELSPLNVQFRRNVGREVEYFSKEQLLDLMIENGFKNLDGYSNGMLRRIWLAYNYDQFFWDVHYKTNLPISIIYAYFIMEATLEGVESDLMATYMNPGGIKYRGIGSKTKAYDDCFDNRGNPIKCDFAVFENYDDMVNGWASVFNQERYADCVSYNTAGQICKCLYKSGYHTANNWQRRANLSREYWKLRRSFP